MKRGPVIFIFVGLMLCISTFTSIKLIMSGLVCKKYTYLICFFPCWFCGLSWVIHKFTIAWKKLKWHGLGITMFDIILFGSLPTAIDIGLTYAEVWHFNAETSLMVFSFPGFLSTTYSGKPLIIPFCEIFCFDVFIFWICEMLLSIRQKNLSK